MFYQEKIINGILHFRNSPDGKWIEMTKEQLTKIITMQNKRIVESDDINNLSENSELHKDDVSYRSIEDCRKVIQEFANRFKLIFEEEGECGFGRECVGLTNGNNYVDYNPTNSVNYEYIKEFYNEKFYDITPADAYHKHDCLAVLGRGEEAIRQLADWVDKLNEMGVVVEKYETGATGLQAMFSGTHNYAVRVL